MACAMYDPNFSLPQLPYGNKIANQDKYLISQLLHTKHHIV